MIWVKGLPVGEGCEKVFKNKRRQSWVIVQGRFKRRVPVADLYTGQMFARKISDVPAAIITAVTFLVQSFTRVVSSASVIENTDAPMVIYPLILAAQSVHVSTPGYEPEVSPEVDLEDCSLMVPGEFEGHTPSVAERKAFFSKALNRKVSLSHSPIVSAEIHVPVLCITCEELFPSSGKPCCCCCRMFVTIPGMCTLSISGNM